jgi:hypothetical protein
LPPRDTPGAVIRQLTDYESRPDGLSRASAEAAWRAVTPPLAGTPHVRISRDGGRTYPARYARPLPADPPGQPCTVPVYDPGAGTGRILALDLDPARGRAAADPAGQVSDQADAIVQLVARLGGRCVTDVAPGGGRHVYVLFAAPLPWRELRDLARAMALRFPAIDVAPMSSLGGQISPPGSRHKSGSWRQLAGPLQDARAAAGRPNGPELWNSLLAEFAAELRRGSGAADPGAAELDDAGVPWLPRLGGHTPLGAELDHAGSPLDPPCSDGIPAPASPGPARAGSAHTMRDSLDLPLLACLPSGRCLLQARLTLRPSSSSTAIVPPLRGRSG